MTKNKKNSTDCEGASASPALFPSAPPPSDEANGTNIMNLGFTPKPGFEAFMVQSMTDLRGQIALIEGKVEQHEQALNDAAGCHKSVAARFFLLEQKVGYLEAKCRSMGDHANDQERRARRANLRFLGIEEHRDEDPLALMEDLLKGYGAPVKLSIAHRCAGSKKNEPRPMIVKLMRLCDRDKVYAIAKSLREDDIQVFDDLSRADYTVKRTLWPYVKQAIGENGAHKGERASFKNGAWYIGGQKVTLDAQRQLVFV